MALSVQTEQGKKLLKLIKTSVAFNSHIEKLFREKTLVYYYI